MCTECEQCNENAIRSISTITKLKALERDQMDIKNQVTEDSEHFKIQINKVNHRLDRHIEKNEEGSRERGKERHSKIIKAALIVVVPIVANEFGIDISGLFDLLA